MDKRRKIQRKLRMRDRVFLRFVVKEYTDSYWRSYPVIKKEEYSIPKGRTLKIKFKEYEDALAYAKSRNEKCSDARYYVEAIILPHGKNKQRTVYVEPLK